MPAVAVTVTFLEMTDPAALRPARDPGVAHLSLARAELPAPELHRFLYATVGGAWNWNDKLPWTLEQWSQYAQRPGSELWVAYERGTPAGYFELCAVDGEVELCYFGLLPGFEGRGLGGWLLTHAIARAWDAGPPATRRVWVHTCTLDSPHALTNYIARGLEAYREHTERREV